jgi:hypothetical protein
MSRDTWKNHREEEENPMTALIERTEEEAVTLMREEVETPMTEENEEEVAQMKRTDKETNGIEKKEDSWMVFQMPCNSGITMPLRSLGKECKDLNSRMPTDQSIMLNLTMRKSKEAGRAVTKTVT